MISVVIPLYNKQLFIAQAIESVLAQQFRDFELLVINDGSTDGSRSIVTTYNDKRLRLIDIDRSGVSVARNIGIEASVYNWIAFLDADDWWDENFLAEMIASIRAYPDHNVFASGRTHVFVDVEKRYNNPFIPKEGELGLINFFQVISSYLPLINSSNAMVRKEHFTTAGFFREKQKMHEDHDLWMRLCIGNEVVFINRNLSFYRNTEIDSASNKDYRPMDFCTFLETLLATKSRLTVVEKKYFKKYTNRFVTLTYIKNYSEYSLQENREVFNLAIQLVTGKYNFLLRSLNYFPFKNTYPIFKLFRIYKWTI